MNKGISRVRMRCALSLGVVSALALCLPSAAGAATPRLPSTQARAELLGGMHGSAQIVLSGFGRTAHPLYTAAVHGAGGVK